MTSLLHTLIIKPSAGLKHNIKHLKIIEHIYTSLMTPQWRPRVLSMCKCHTIGLIVIMYAIIVVDCPNAPTVNNGWFTYNPSTNPRYGTVASYFCFSGWTMTGSTNTISCGKTGRWSGKKPSCRSKNL